MFIQSIQTIDKVFSECICNHTRNDNPSTIGDLSIIYIISLLFNGVADGKKGKDYLMKLFYLQPKAKCSQIAHYDLCASFPKNIRPTSKAQSWLQLV